MALSPRKIYTTAIEYVTKTGNPGDPTKWELFSTKQDAIGYCKTMARLLEGRKLRRRITAFVGMDNEKHDKLSQLRMAQQGRRPNVFDKIICLEDGFSTDRMRKVAEKRTAKKLARLNSL